jgi:hypothetical protein
MLALGAAASLEAQSTNNTQRALRPGQTKGPNFMVPVFRSSDRALGVQVADVLRDRLMSDNLMTSMWVIPKKDLIANLEQSGYSGSDALSTSDLKQLAQFVRAEEYVDGVVTREADGTLSLAASLNLPRGDGMEQPLTPASGTRPGDIAARMSDEIEKARKQIKGATDCLQANRQRQYDDARQLAARAIREFPNAVFARVCLLEIAISRRAAALSSVREPTFEAASQPLPVPSAIGLTKSGKGSSTKRACSARSSTAKGAVGTPASRTRRLATALSRVAAMVRGSENT